MKMRAKKHHKAPPKNAPLNCHSGSERGPDAGKRKTATPPVEPEDP